MSSTLVEIDPHKLYHVKVWHGFDDVRTDIMMGNVLKVFLKHYPDDVEDYYECIPD